MESRGSSTRHGDVIGGNRRVIARYRVPLQIFQRRRRSSATSADVRVTRESLALKASRNALRSSRSAGTHGTSTSFRLEAIRAFGSILHGSKGGCG